MIAGERVIHHARVNAEDAMQWGSPYADQKRNWDNFCASPSTPHHALF
jgi:hypothetical protein